MKITLHAANNFDKVIERETPCSIEEIVNSLQGEFPYEILLCRIDGRPAPLNTVPDHDCTVDLLDLRSAAGNMAYQISLTFLYIKAVHDVLGTNTRVVISNSLSKGLFTQIRAGGIDDTTAGKIASRMNALIRADAPFTGKRVNRNELEDFLSRYGRKDQTDLLKSSPDLKEAYLYTLDGETEVFYHLLVPSAGYLKWFEVRRYKNGMLLRFPHQSRPDMVLPFEEQKQLYDAFSDAYHWDKIMRVEYAADLNKLINRNDYSDLVLLSEALHEKKIAEIAEEIKRLGKRIVLVAGPSSSGKTSFAKRLCIQLRVSGLRPLYMGTDDYFLERWETPLLENGEKDYESIRAMDINLFTKQMNDLLSGKKVDLPEFDFITGTKTFGKRFESLEPGQPVVLEGIHSLNPALTNGIADELKYRIYISPLTQLNIDEHNRVPTTDGRLLRRMVRDYQFRGYNAQHTIHAWPSVRAGEEQNVFPYDINADIFFNSHCLYELTALKKYAKPLLEQITPDEEEYMEARRLLDFLACFSEMPDDSIIPNNSLIREFIGGSVLM